LAEDATWQDHGHLSGAGRAKETQLTDIRAAGERLPKLHAVETSNSPASDTRSMVAWNVERLPNSDRNCFGRTSREAGHSRVAAPPHMISGMIRWSMTVNIVASQTL
jgi:hypothetical protein